MWQKSMQWIPHRESESLTESGVVLNVSTTLLSMSQSARRASFTLICGEALKFLSVIVMVTLFEAVLWAYDCVSMKLPSVVVRWMVNGRVLGPLISEITGGFHPDAPPSAKSKPLVIGKPGVLEHTA